MPTLLISVLGDQHRVPPIWPHEGVFPTPYTRSFFFHLTLTSNPKSMSLNSDTQICSVGTRHSTLLHWQSHLLVDTGHYTKFQVDVRHSDPPSWALPMLMGFFIRRSTLSSKILGSRTRLSSKTAELKIWSSYSIMEWKENMSALRSRFPALTQLFSYSIPLGHDGSTNMISRNVKWTSPADPYMT